MRKVIYLLIMAGLFFSCLGCENIQSSLWQIEADIFYNQGQFKKSIEFYQKLIRLNPLNADYYWHLGLAYYSDNQKSKVKTQIGRLEALGREDLANDLQQLLGSQQDSQ